MNHPQPSHPPITLSNNTVTLESNYHSRKFFTGNLFAIEIKKSQIPMNKPVYLGLSIKFWYDYVKPQYGKKVKLCYRKTQKSVL